MSSPFESFKSPLGNDPFKDSLKGFDDAAKKFDNDRVRAAANAENPQKEPTIAASPDDPKANLEHSRDLFDLKLLQLARISAEADGKTLAEEDLKRMRELMTRASQEEVLEILAYANAMVEKNKANQKPPEAEATKAYTVCKNCGRKVEAGSFCAECGAPIEESKRPGVSILEADENKFVCLKCGNFAEPGESCNKCGTRIFNGVEMALCRTINVKPAYLIAHPNEALSILKMERNAYLMKKRAVENNLEQYRDEAEVAKVIDVYGKFIKKFS